MYMQNLPSFPDDGLLMVALKGHPVVHKSFFQP